MAHPCTSMIKNGPSMYLNDKKWPIDVPIKTGKPIHVPHFRKKRDPLMYLAAWFCDPCLRHIPITTFVLSTSPAVCCMLCPIRQKKKKKSCLFVLTTHLIFENWKKVFTVPKYTAPNFQNSKKGFFLSENFDLLKIFYSSCCQLVYILILA